MFDNNINFNEVEEAKSQFAESLEPGIHLVKILSLDTVTTDDKNQPVKSPYIAMKLENKEGVHDERMYVSSPKAIEFTKGRLKTIGLAALNGDTKALQALGTVESISEGISGKMIWVKITGEEKVSKKGNNFVDTSLAYPPFCCSVTIIEEGGKKRLGDNLDKAGEGIVKLIPSGASGFPKVLKFNPARDLKKLAAAPAQQDPTAMLGASDAPAGGGNGVDDLPF